MPEKNRETTAFSLDDIDRVIHMPARLLLMKVLYVLAGADMVFLKRETGLTWGNLSVQVKNLEEAGYVSIEKEFVDNKPHTLIRITPEGQAAYEAYRKRIKDILK